MTSAHEIGGPADPESGGAPDVRRRRLPRWEPCPVAGKHLITKPAQKYCDLCRGDATRRKDRDRQRRRAERLRGAARPVTITDDAEGARAVWRSLTAAVADAERTRARVAEGILAHAPRAAEAPAAARQRDEALFALRRLLTQVQELRDVLDEHLR